MRDFAVKKWTPEEDAILLSISIKEAAIQLGRTYKSANVRKWRLLNNMV
jgi:hypothetical protein